MPHVSDCQDEQYYGGFNADWFSFVLSCCCLGGAAPAHVATGLGYWSELSELAYEAAGKGVNLVLFVCCQCTVDAAQGCTACVLIYYPSAVYFSH